MNSGNKIELRQVIKLLGGNAKVAKLCDVTPGAVSQWLHNGIPKAQLKFLRLARPEIFAKFLPNDEPAPTAADSQTIHFQ